jgi:hypothetical protein
MLQGEPFTLGARDAAILAAFTFMKAVVTDHIADNHEPFFTRAEREGFKRTLTLPGLMKAWFAAYQGAARMSTRSNAAVYSTSTPGPLYGIEFLSFTYVVGQLALQLLAPRWKDIRYRALPVVSLSPHVYWESATTLFWPHKGTPLSWPPSKYLGDDIIQAFIERFGNKVSVPVS